MVLSRLLSFLLNNELRHLIIRLRSVKNVKNTLYYNQLPFNIKQAELPFRNPACPIVLELLIFKKLPICN